MGPYWHQMAGELAASSECFAAKQWSSTAGLDDGDSMASSLLGNRRWPLLQAAKGDFDAQIHEEMYNNEDTVKWNAFPDCAKTVNLRHRLFKASSRALVYFYEHFIVRHRLPPYDLLRLVADQSGHLDVRNRCTEIRDPYSTSFVDYWSVNGGLVCAAALLELAIMIVFGRTNTCRIESLNAFLRRLVSCRTQTHVMSLLDLSTRFILSRVRIRNKSLYKPAGLVDSYKRKTKVRKDCSKPGGGKQKRRGGGGPWRAYVSHRLRGAARASFRGIAGDYATLSPDERARFKRFGVAGSTAHRARAAARLIGHQDSIGPCEKLFATAPYDRH